MKKSVKTLIKKGVGRKPHKDWGLIGFFDSPDVNSQLALIAFSLGEGKSQLIRRIVSQWLKDKDAVTIALNALEKQLDELRLPSSELNVKALRTLLRGKGVSSKYIEEMIKRLA